MAAVARKACAQPRPISGEEETIEELPQPETAGVL